MKAQLAGLALRLLGWKIVGEQPAFKKCVVVGAHHTSNLDGVYMVVLSAALGFDVHWFGKHTLFRGLTGVIMRAVGGVPLDRSSSLNAVEQAVALFNARDEFRLVVSPEGTRSKVTRWKTGFYYIALDANVPLVCGFADYRTREMGVGLVVHPTGDLEADFEPIREFYSTITARFPERAGDLKVVPKRTRQTREQAS